MIQPDIGTLEVCVRPSGSPVEGMVSPLSGVGDDVMYEEMVLLPNAILTDQEDK